MKTVTKQKHGYMDRSAKEMTYQAPFASSVKCSAYGKLARLVILVEDDEGSITVQRPKDHRGIWPHDCVAMASYLCGKCGEITTKWNQA